MKIEFYQISLWLLVVLMVLCHLDFVTAANWCQQCGSLGRPMIQCSEKEHKFCKSCVEKSALDQMSRNDGKFGRKLPCLDNECHCWIHEAQVRRSLPLGMKIQRFQQLRENQKECAKRECDCCFGENPTVLCPDGHALCAKCIESESTEQLNGNREPVTRQPYLSCVGVGCRLKLPESQVRRVMGRKIHQVRASRLQELWTFVLPERCPGCQEPGQPGNVIRNLDRQLLCDLIECHNPACGIKYCAQCGEQTDVHHKCQDKAAYQRWTTLLKKSVPCPNCRRFVQRNGGCSHMQCLCGWDFCYDCGSGHYDKNRMPRHFKCDHCLETYRKSKNK